MDQAQYQHGQPITPIGKLNGRAADALQKFTRPTTAPNAWDEDQPHSHILSGASSVLHVRHLLQAPPIDVIIPGQSEDALLARPGTHSPTNASIRATTIGNSATPERSMSATFGFRFVIPLTAVLREVPQSPTRSMRSQVRDRRLRYQRTSVPDGKSSTRPASS